MTVVKRRGCLLGYAEDTPESLAQRGRRGDARSIVGGANVLSGEYPLCSEIVSVPTERDDVLPDPDYLQEGVQGLVGLLVRLGEPDKRDVADCRRLADREAEPIRPWAGWL